MHYSYLLYLVAVMVASFDWAAALFEKSNSLEKKKVAMNIPGFGQKYELKLSTLNVIEIGYAGNLYMEFLNENGDISDTYVFLGVVLFPGITISRTFWLKKEFGKIKTIQISLSNILDFTKVLRWGAQLVQVIPSSSHIPINFPCVRRIEQKSKSNIDYYRFDEFNTYLPQYDTRSTEDRRKELEDNRKVYAFSTRHLVDPFYRGTPLIKTIPFSELFPVGYSVYTGINVVKEAVGNGLHRSFSPPTWKSYDDMRRIFQKKIIGIQTLKTPLYINKDFESDVWFARQRLQGPNPAMIKLATKIPDTFNKKEFIFGNLLEGKSLEFAVQNKKIFIVDLNIMHGLYEDYKINVSAPIALFYLNNNKVLLPVAIQLFQGIRESNPVFTPRDKKLVWQNAKNHFQVADGNHHESITHLGTTHLLIESVIGCTYQNLAHNHPVFRLLRPHFLSTLAINKLAFSALVADGTAIDLTISIQGFGMSMLAGLGLQDYDMARDAIVPTMFDRAGLDKVTLEDYPFRDDFSLVYKTIRKFVKEIVELYYTDDSDLDRDSEIQAWRRQLTAPRNEGVEGTDEAKGRYGLGLKGVPGTDDGFSTLEELIEVVTVIIHTASTKHAAINFLQYDWYAFAPHHPLFLFGPFPTSKAPVTQQQILDQFAGKNRFMNLVLLVDALSNRLTQNLGYPEVPMFYDPRATNIVDKFRWDLQNVHKEIERRNKVRNTNSYIWCDVNRVPNAISI